jgi:predicted extracellular nuclease
MKSPMRRLSLWLALSGLSATAAADLVITGVIDGPLPGGVPKAVELFATTNIADLSAYGLGAANNGGGSDGQEFSFPAVGLNAGEFIYVATESVEFQNFFGFAPDYTDGDATAVNGDDAIELFKNGSVIDTFGDINADGTGTAWDYLDGWAYRKAGTTAGAFNVADWNYSGINALDGAASNASATTPFPAASYGGGNNNGEPNANAGADREVLEGASVTLDGSASSDSDGTITGFAWEQIGGVNVALDLTDPARPAFTAPNAGTLTFRLTVTDNDGKTASDTVVITVEAPAAACNTATHKIHEVQGTGASTPLNNQTVTVQAVVTKVLQHANSFSGYMLMEEDADRDANAASSEGIFVFDTTNNPSVGDQVAITAQAAEYFGLTQLKNVSAFETCDNNVAVSPVDLTLPLNNADALEAYEGMLVRFPQTLTVTETYWLARMGQLTLSINGKQDNPTQVAMPGAAANNLAAANDLARIVMDDGIKDSGYATQNPDPVQYPGFGVLTYDNPIRSGYTLQNLTGVVHYASNYVGQHKNAHRLIPTENVSFTAANARGQHSSVPSVPGDLKIASFNVLNYFTTLDGNGAICGPSSNMNCRGADDANELARQKTKIVNAIAAMDADVVGLIEIENHATDDALIDLVNGLNSKAGAGSYSYVDTGSVGGDAIKVALIYKSAAVDLVGSWDVLDYADDKNRPTVIQTFKPAGTADDSKNFTVAVNHFKSKGSPCDSIGDPNQNDGQGNCNATRTKAATMLINHLQNNAGATSSQGYLVLGDLNAYAKEDPVRAFIEAGYQNLVANKYSYVFDGEWGTLDYALASSNLQSLVKGAAVWNINSDEPAGFDYDTSFKKNTQDASYYNPSFFRSSDHDPVIVGLGFASAPQVPQCNGVAATIYVAQDGTIAGGPQNGQVFKGVLKGSNKADVIVGTAGNDVVRGGKGNDLICTLGGRDWVFGDAGKDTVYAGEGNDLVYGGNGNDQLHGEAGKDYLYGQNGKDQLTGGADKDLLHGGRGKDTCWNVESDRAISCNKKTR